MTPLEACRFVLNDPMAGPLAERAFAGEPLCPEHVRALGAYLLAARQALKGSLAMVDRLEAEVAAEASIARGDGFVWTPEP